MEWAGEQFWMMAARDFLWQNFLGRIVTVHMDRSLGSGPSRMTGAAVMTG